VPWLIISLSHSMGMLFVVCASCLTEDCYFGGTFVAAWDAARADEPCKSLQCHKMLHNSVVKMAHLVGQADWQITVQYS
jgi:hypothetical protein